jgi:outer membrane protein OmpA-like peptidoglycan-associated protein
MRFKGLSIVLLYFIPISSWASELNAWKVSIGGGYSMLSQIQAASIENGFPIQAGLGLTITDKWSSKIEYQWINSEHLSGSAVNIQSLHILPRYDFLNHRAQRFGFEAGIGYQWTNLEGIDQVRLFEWLMGPTWTYRINGPWCLESTLRYSHSSTTPLGSALHSFSMMIGFSFEFGMDQSKSQNNFVDSDQDGISNDIDQCSNTPHGAKVSKIGCPPDGDGDLVADIQDYCPNTKHGMEVDEIGCPLIVPGRGLIDGIAFENDSPRLTSSSKNHLLEIAENLKKFPNIYFVIEGYSSGTSSSIERLYISKARALTVMNVLASHGVPSNKMKAVGLSDMYPLTESTLPSDQILNERIEIKWKHRL